MVPVEASEVAVFRDSFPLVPAASVLKFSILTHFESWLSCYIFDVDWKELKKV